jgi:glycosyltransferase involved in cell wall biosynthesis
MGVSVIIPTRNRSALLRMALHSVLRQRDIELEVIVVDDGSTDDTPAVLAACRDRRVHAIRNGTPSGMAGIARNRGAAAAQAEWLAFLDDDDFWAPDKLVRQIEEAEQTGRDWAYSGAIVLNPHGRILRVQRPLPPEEILPSLLRYDAIPGGGSNVIMRRATWQQVGPFDTRLRSGEDWEMWIRLAKHGTPACVPSPLVARRLHYANVTLDIAEIVRGTQLIEALHDTTADWGRLHRWMAHSYMRTGRRGAALGQFARAAARGQLGAVAFDLTVIAIASIAGNSPNSKANRPRAGDAWVSAAAGWIQELRTSFDASRRDAGTRDSHSAPHDVSGRAEGPETSTSQ